MEKMTNDSHLVKDLLEGDESIKDREDYNILTPKEISDAVKIIVNNKSFSEQTKKFLLLNTWRINYKIKPPTMEEFLSPEWIGSISESLFPYWKDILINLTNPKTKEKNLILYSPIGTGKSTMVALLNLYISTIIYLMNNPKKTLRQSAATSLCNVFVAQSLDKAKEVLLEPFINILTSSEKFVQCRTIEQMKKLEKEHGTNKICWTTASMASALTIGNNMSIKIKSNSASLLGLTILCGSITELAFFKEVGYSDEDIMKLYNDLKGRIKSRFPTKNGLNFSILDSSPNDATFESSIDYWILNEARKNPENFIFNDTKWNLQPWLFPDWEKTGKTFYIYKGSGDKQSKIIENKMDIEQYNKEDIVECPIDIYTLAVDDTSKVLKDYAGIPTAISNRLIKQNSKIEQIFDPQFRNIYSHLTALEDEQPEHLLWDKIKDEFFIEISPGKFEFYRNPLEERFVSVDQSITGDTACIGVTHPELDMDGQLIDIIDMSICIIPNKARINLDAIKFLICDLVNIGKMNIQHVSFDQFQSESAQQFLKRLGFLVEHLSVDSDMSPYLNMVQQINLNRLKGGKNIYIKNNLKSIKISKTKTGKPKIDHEIGKVENSLHANDNWETSSLGFNAKDSTDAIAASIELRRKYYEGSPQYVYSKKDVAKNCDNDDMKILKNLKLSIKR
jgi:hypothetical protein